MAEYSTERRALNLEGAIIRRSLAPIGNLVVVSEHPFGATLAGRTVRQRDASTGRLVRVFRPDDSVRSDVRGVYGSVRAAICFASRRTKSSGPFLRLARASVRSCATQTSTAWLWTFFERRDDENPSTQDAAISQKALQF
jgi:hypothetical protein